MVSSIERSVFMTGEQFKSLWLENAGLVYSYAARRVGRDAAGDVVAETFAVAWRRREEVPSPALPWLYGVAWKVISQHHRSEARYLRLVDRASYEPKAASVSPEVRVIESQLLDQALMSLDPLDREALLLVAWEGLRPGEAALVMGYSAGAFRVRLSRAKRRMRVQLEQASVQTGVEK